MGVTYRSLTPRPDASPPRRPSAVTYIRCESAPSDGRVAAPPQRVEPDEHHGSSRGTLVPNVNGNDTKRGDHGCYSRFESNSGSDRADRLGRPSSAYDCGDARPR